VFSLHNRAQRFQRAGIARWAGERGALRAYQIGPDGRIRSGADLDCADDEAAIEAAKQLVGEFDVELWQAKRMVARLEATKK
jgi:hypothetical protein